MTDTSGSLGGELRQLRQAAATGEFPINGPIEAHGIAPEGVVQVYGPGAVGFGKQPLNGAGSGK